MNKTVVLLLLNVLLLAMLSLSSCRSRSSEKQQTEEKSHKAAITALVRQSADEEDPDQEQEQRSHLVLEQGNYWTNGIPGFGENALSAFTGQYRIPGKSALIQVWLTREFIYYDRWARRTSITSHTVQQKAEDMGRVISTSINNTWTLIALLPGGTELSLEEEDKLILVFINGLSEVVNQATQTASFSLPAMIPVEL